MGSANKVIVGGVGGTMALSVWTMVKDDERGRMGQGEDF
jgi:hypothetical protein